MLSRKPLTVADRIVAVLLALLCCGAGVVAFVLGIRLGRVLLVVGGPAAIVVGLLFARAAWIGRPLSLPGG